MLNLNGYQNINSFLLVIVHKVRHLSTKRTTNERTVDSLCTERGYFVLIVLKCVEAICPLCFGMLQKVELDEFQEPIFNRFLNCGYEDTEYSLSITVPLSTFIRHYAIYCYLLKTFGYEAFFHCLFKSNHCSNLIAKKRTESIVRCE